MLSVIVARCVMACSSGGHGPASAAAAVAATAGDAVSAAAVGEPEPAGRDFAEPARPEFADPAVPAAGFPDRASHANAASADGSSPSGTTYATWHGARSTSLTEYEIR